MHYSIIRKSIVLLYAISLFIITILPNICSNNNLFSANAKEGLDVPTVIINIDPFTEVYEGDIIDCEITGDPTTLFWQINDESHHSTFFGDNPVIFDPEPTPLGDEFVDLTVYAENENGSGSDTVQIKLFRIFFGDIHWHTVFSDGDFKINSMYKNAVEDNYLDFTACTDHGELLDGISTKFGGVREWDIIRTFIEKVLGFSEWQMMKDKAIEYYNPGTFTTLLGFEWTAAQWSWGGKDWSPNGWEDVSHINFYYRDVYPNALEYADYQKFNYDDIFKAMSEEWDKGHLNIGFSHHPLGRASRYNFTTNWTFMADKIINTNLRDKIHRGVETFSRWGNSIGEFTPDVPWLWPYNLSQFTNQTEAWVENACWEWSDDELKGQKFVFIGGSDTHDYDRPGSAEFDVSYLGKPSGIAAVYAVHNIREEIWDALNDCYAYSSQLLKIRANVRLDGQLSYGRWINCSSPLKIRLSAHSTFPGNDTSGKRMWPHGYSPNELDYPITDIWLVKKDSDRGQPWCKVINHTQPNSNMVIENFEDSNVKPNDFYWVAIKQKGQKLMPENGDEFISYVGPFFIDSVI
ncbi:MAG: hypothetical protein AYK22_06685 [Thermoplasmatales archaeon SG8-52-3]|nr:MAG: hypothetical protein AYK22_06685 [Thermoplasmatales archaeon SG8-52-3]